MVKYDSNFEKLLHNSILSKCVYKPSNCVAYITKKIYHPDFTYYNEELNILYYIEVKGRFRTSEEARKYLGIRDSLDDITRPGFRNHELVFLFQDPNKPMPNAKKRKDGTKFTHKDWADKHKFQYFTKGTIVDILG